MSGTKGRSGGRNAKGLAELLVRQTYQRSRHAHLTMEVPPEIEALTTELRIEKDRAKFELSAWRKLAREKPTDAKAARQVVFWSRHYCSLVMALQQRIAQQQRPASETDAFTAFQQRRRGPSDDPAA
jgi:hypothetical protein